jgi:predicted nucleic acid-binding protein
MSLAMLTIDANVWVAAADRQDDFHAQSRRFVAEVSTRVLRIYLPAIAPIEIACALGRRRRNAEAGEKLANALLDSDHVVIVRFDDYFTNNAIKLGTGLYLRGADAQYFTVSHINQTALVSWDNELIQRANALTPSTWLAQNL